MSKFSSGGGSASAEAAKARQAEAQRQARIKQGMAEIDRIFGGGVTASNPVTNYQVGSTYYLADGTPVVYDSRMIGDTPTPLTPMQKQGYQRTGNVPAGYTTDRYGNLVPMETQRQATGYLKDGQFNELGKNVLYSNITRSSGFDDAFFNQRANDYRAYAMPQLEREFNNAREQLIYALSRSGNIRSSTAANKQRDLKMEYDRNLQNIENQAQQVSNTARMDVENNRAQLIQMLQASADPAAAGKDATARAAMLSQPAGFDPVQIMFSDVAGTMADAAAARRARSEPTGISLFAPRSGGSGSIVRGG